MQLKSGLRLKSSVCDANVIVVRAPAAADVDLRCGGVPMVEANAVAPEPVALDPRHAAGTAMGKRYGDEHLELLCTKPGAGSLSIGDEPLGVRAAKALPSSD